METGAILERPEDALKERDEQHGLERVEMCVDTLMAKYGELTLDEQHALCEAVDTHGRSLVEEIFKTLDLPVELLEGKELIPQLKDYVNELQKDSLAEPKNGGQANSSQLRFTHSLIKALRSEVDKVESNQNAELNPWEKKKDFLLSPEFLKEISDFFDDYDTQFNDPEFALHGNADLYTVYYEKHAGSNSIHFQFYPIADRGRPQARSQVSLGTFRSLSEFKHAGESFKKLVAFLERTPIEKILEKHMDPRYPCLVAQYGMNGKLHGTHTTRKDANLVGVRIGEFGSHEEEIQHFKEYIGRTFASVRAAAEVIGKYKGFR